MALINRNTSLLCASILVSACSSQAQPAADRADRIATPTVSAPAFDTTASIRELMNAVIDPAADGLWGSVATVSDEAGVNRHQPRTDAEWVEVRRHAVTLMEGMNLVMMEGRKAAPVGTAQGDGELSPRQIDALLASDHDSLIAFAQNLQGTTRTALAAIDKRDPQALFEAGSEIDKACESCHVTFWYPETADPRLGHAKTS